MNMHFCGGKVVKTSFSIGLHNPDCGMAKIGRVCEGVFSTENQVTQRSCCENQHQVLQLDENMDIHFSKVSINPVFCIAFVQTFIQRLPFADQKIVHDANYVPPLPDKDIQVLFQTFLI